MQVSHTESLIMAKNYNLLFQNFCKLISPSDECFEKTLSGLKYLRIISTKIMSIKKI